MSTKLKRLTFVITPGIESILDKAKKELFYNQSQSQMIRKLIIEGAKKLEINSKNQD